MTTEDIEYKEKRLREEFKKRLELLDVNGENSLDDVKCLKLFGVLWHITHQLLLAERSKDKSLTAETVNMQATGLKMIGGK